MKQVKWLAHAAGIVVVAGLVAVFAAPARPAAVRGGVLTMAWPADEEPANLDAQVDPYDSTKLFNSFVADPLIRLNSNGQYGPALAASWTVSPDGKVWTLALRKGMKFSDGTRFNAAAVKFNVDRIMDPNTHSAEVANFLGAARFQRAEAVNDSTVRIVYSGPVPIAFWGLSVAPMWSPAAVKQYGTAFPQHLTGAGPFRLAEWVRGDHIRFVRNPDYAGTPPLQEHSGPAYLDGITVRFVGDPGVLGQVLKSGEANLVAELPSQSLSDYRNNPDYRLVLGFQPGTGMQFVMNTGRPALKDVRVRKALRFAYDPDKINQTLYGGTYVTVKGPLTPSSRFYWKGAEAVYHYDPAAAGRLLDEAGWKLNSRTGIREKNGTPLSLTLVLLHHKEIGEYLSAQFKQVGVDLKVAVVPGPVQLQRAQSGNFDLIYERQRTFEPDGSLFAIWYSKNDKPGGWAWSRFHNDALDAVLLKTQSASSQPARQQLWTSVQRMVTDYALALPTVDDPVYYGMRKNVQGFKLGAIGNWFFVNDLYIEQ